MTLRSGHGTGTGVPRIEVLPADELQQPDPSPASSPTLAWGDMTPEQRHEAAKAWGRRGALVRASRTRLLGSLGLTVLGAEHDFHGYEKAGEAFAEKHVETLGAMFDGHVGEGPASIVMTAAIQLAASRFMYDRGKDKGDAKLLGEASKLGDASRQNILASYELQAREAAARKAGGNADPLAKWRTGGEL